MQHENLATDRMLHLLSALPVLDISSAVLIRHICLVPVIFHLERATKTLCSESSFMKVAPSFAVLRNVKKELEELH